MPQCRFIGAASGTRRRENLNFSAANGSDGAGKEWNTNGDDCCTLPILQFLVIHNENEGGCCRIDCIIIGSRIDVMLRKVGMVHRLFVAGKVRLSGVTSHMAVFWNIPGPVLFLNISSSIQHVTN